MLGAGEPVVKIDPGMNVTGRERVRVVARRGEVIAPLEPADDQLVELVELARERRRLADGVVCAAGVDEHNLVDVIPEARETPAHIRPLVLRDHAHRQARRIGDAGVDRDSWNTPPGEPLNLVCDQVTSRAATAVRIGPSRLRTAARGAGAAYDSRCHQATRRADAVARPGS